MATVFERTFQNHTDLAEVVRAEKELFSDSLGRPSPYLVKFTSHEGRSYLCDLDGKILDGLDIAWAVTNEPIPPDVIEAIESWEDVFQSLNSILSLTGCSYFKKLQR